METTPRNFLGLEEEHSRYDSAQFAILPVPYDSSASYMSGSRNAPTAIISASEHLEWFDEELHKECFQCGIATLDPIEPNLDGPKSMQDDLCEWAGRVISDGKFPFALGGDHSITGGLVRAAWKAHPDLSVLQIDAHLDLRDQYYGSSYMHACVMRRTTELGINVVPVGIRAVAPEEHEFLQGRHQQPVMARECHTQKDWMDRVLASLGETVYVTIDIDGFDPAHAPGTGTPEPGGLDWYQVTGLLRRVASQKKIVAADVVEVMPVPGQVVTEFLAARVVYKLICYVQQAK